MIAQFVSFIIIAVISFSGLLFALWTLGMVIAYYWRLINDVVS